MEGDVFTSSDDEGFDDFEANEIMDSDKDSDQDWVGSNKTPSSVQINELKNPDPEMVDMTEHFTTKKTFKSKDEVKKWCNVRGLEVSIVVLTHKSEPKRLEMQCERSGEYTTHKKKVKEPEARALALSSIKRRKTSTMKCKCPFRVKGVFLQEGKWGIQVICGLHNHALGPILTGHPYVARLTKDEQKMVEDMMKSGINARGILLAIRSKNPASKSIMKTIHNAKTIIRKRQREGRTMLQQLMNLLEENRYIHYELLDSNNADAICSIFWAHPESIILLKCFPEVLVVDCTYKTNRYGLPLLQIVGATSTNKTFVAAMCFLKNEKSYSFDWAFEHLHSLLDEGHMPRVIVSDRELACISAIEKNFSTSKRMVCEWHVRKNIVANCKKHMENKAWKKFFNDVQGVIFAETKDVFTKALGYFEATWGVSQKNHVDYIRDTWWRPHKEQIVSAWTNELRHYGHSTTQRVESSHRALKKHMRDRTSTFESIFHIAHSMVAIQINEINGEFQSSRRNTKNEHREVPQFTQLINKVSLYALDLLMTELHHAINNMTTSSIVPCFHTTRTICGLPCACDLQPYVGGQCIPLEMIDPHWRQLSMEPNHPESRGKIELEPILVRLDEKWKKESEKARFVLARKLEHVLAPVVTSVKPPISMLPGRERRREKGLTKKQRDAIYSSTRDPSGFEYVEDIDAQDNGKKRKQSHTLSQVWYKSCIQSPYMYPNASYAKASQIVEKTPCASSSSCKVVENTPDAYAKTSQVVGNTPGVSSPSCKFVEDTPGTSSKASWIIPKVEKENAHVVMIQDPMVMYMPLMPECMQSYIENIHEVRGDGNCGFRAVAQQLGLDYKGGWITVKAKLKNELQLHQEFYKNMFYSLQFENLKKSLSKSISPAAEDYWMSMPETGHLIATVFNVVVVYLSKPLSLTFFPLRGMAQSKHRVIRFAHTGASRHFVGLTLQRDHPMPPISVLWGGHCDGNAASWSDPYSLRLQRFEEIRPRDMDRNDIHVID